MRRNVLVAIPVAALISIAAFSQTPAPAFRKVTSVEGITEYAFPNGLRVLLFPDPSKPKVTVNMTYLVGSRHEGYGETGMAHLLEHLHVHPRPRRGPTSRRNSPTTARRWNGTTSYDRTNYFETVTATDENLRWALGLEADRMVNTRMREGDPRHRNDGGAQRVRDGREQPGTACSKARARRPPTCGTTTASPPSARAPTSRTCRSTGWRRSTASTTSPTTPC